VYKCLRDKLSEVIWCSNRIVCCGHNFKWQYFLHAIEMLELTAWIRRQFVCIAAVTAHLQSVLQHGGDVRMCSLFKLEGTRVTGFVWRLKLNARKRCVHVVCLSDTHSKGLFSWESWVPEWMIWRCSLNLHFHSYKERSSWRDAKIIVSVQSYMLCGSKQYNLLNIGRCIFDKVIT